MQRLYVNFSLTEIILEVMPEGGEIANIFLRFNRSI
jgi:hypothetical protein